MQQSADRPVLSVDLSAPDPIPEAGIERAVELMRSGLLFRYGEDRTGELEVSALEKEFAEYMGTQYAVALNSCGASLFVALKCADVQPGDKVLVNAFTLAPVPGSIAHADANAIFVECTDDYTIDLEDLEQKANSGAKVLLMSHMRGHIADMEAVAELCNRLGVCLIEDCAHTMGAKWNRRPTGTFGAIGCFSGQTFKHINSGEGGLLVTNDDEIAAKAILYSGSYMLYAQNGARPPLEVFERFKYQIPNFSLRMSGLAAAMLRPQLQLLSERAETWNARYQLLASLLRQSNRITVPKRSNKEEFVASSIQFSVHGLNDVEMDALLKKCDARGVHIKWFGRSEPLGFTSLYGHWGYVRDVQRLEQTDKVLKTMCDMRIPLCLTEDDCHTIAKIVHQSLVEVSA
ncbi:MAG: aminotransferase class I/II-fold pyridoxal phosphate-dependent enzyme [Gammaproteobacteria bacterium]|nr:aminotransferase class I/II-fold pyridoxal phosphate-dependent enzyme [Gammaproteobacteria bacterium]